MLKQDLTIQIMSQKGHYLKGKQESYWCMRDESCTKTMKEFVELGKKRIVT